MGRCLPLELMWLGDTAGGWSVAWISLLGLCLEAHDQVRSEEQGPLRPFTLTKGGQPFHSSSPCGRVVDNPVSSQACRVQKWSFSPPPSCPLHLATARIVPQISHFCMFTGLYLSSGFNDHKKFCLNLVVGKPQNLSIWSFLITMCWMHAIRELHATSLCRG